MRSWEPHAAPSGSAARGPRSSEPEPEPKNNFLGSQEGSQEESRVPWDDQQDELFAELYAQTFAQVQGKTNGDKMGEMLSASVNENSARLGGRKMTAAQALNRAAYAKAGCAAVWKPPPMHLIYIYLFHASLILSKTQLIVPPRLFHHLWRHLLPSINAQPGVGRPFVKAGVGWIAELPLGVAAGLRDGQALGNHLNDRALSIGNGPAAPVAGVGADSPQRCPPDLAALITECWQQDPRDRPSTGELVKNISLIMKVRQHHHRQPHQAPEEEQGSASRHH
ncbi:hypothetical protein V8C86DRAFT_3197619 [Haematococcus lacustris]